VKEYKAIMDEVSRLKINENDDPLYTLFHQTSCRAAHGPTKLIQGVLISPPPRSNSKSKPGPNEASRLACGFDVRVD